MDTVRTGILYQPCNQLRFLYFKSARNIFFRTHAIEDGKIPACRRADRLYDLPWKSCPVLRSSAIFIASFVGKRRDKLIDQISMRTVNLNPIKTGSLCPQSGVHKCLFQIMDLINAHFTRRFRHRRIFDRRRSDWLFTGDLAGCFSSGMIDLGNGFSTCLVNPIRKHSPRFYLSVFPKAGQCFRCPSSPCYGKILCDDDPISALCLVFMISHEFFSRRSVFVTVIRDHSGDHHAVFKLRLADRDWFKDFRQFHNALLQIAY